MIIDLKKALEERALKPTYDVGMDTYKAGQVEYHLIGGGGLKIANDMSSQMPADHKELKSDEIILDRQGLEYFRYMLLSITERLAKEEIGQLESASRGSKKESAYLRPIFGSVAQSGHNYWEVLRNIRAAQVPIPNEYFVMLPEPDSRSPSRDEIIRALVPFKKAQRAALVAGWNDETTAIRITKGEVSKPSLILQ